jgi:DNA-binding Lrp family transcriptional regulator
MATSRPEYKTGVWRKTDIERLTKLYFDEEKPLLEISELMNRAPGSINYKLRSLDKSGVIMNIRARSSIH